MDVVYKNGTVKKQCTELSQVKRDFSEKVAKKLLKLVNFLDAADNLESILNNPVLHFHALKGKLNGLYAIDIDGRRGSYRLLVRFDDYPQEMVFSNSKSIEIIQVTEVSKHYE